MKVQVSVFDVDGTLLKGDSLLLLFQYLEPSRLKRWTCWFRLLPEIAKGLAKKDLAEAKLGLLNYLWYGKKKEQITDACSRFFEERLKDRMKPAALRYIEKLKIEHHETVILLLSASCSEWLWFLARWLEAGLICTELQYDAEDHFSGELASPNCKGPEKLRRLLLQYPAENYEFTCFGDSPADKALQSVSKEFYYRYF